MPLKFKYVDGCMKPAIICDFCQKEITSAKNGNFNFALPEIEGEIVETYFTHKQCCHSFDLANPEIRGAEMLEYLPVFLTRTLKVDFKEAEIIALSWD